MMEAVIVALDERLANPGDALVCKDHVELDSYTLGGHEFALPSGVDFDVVLTNAGEGILASGIVRATAHSICDRCLDEAVLELTGEVNEYYLEHEPAPEALSDDEDEADFSLIAPDRTIDLSSALMQALLIDTPFVVLCREDCAGLCPVCGENLNHKDCGHKQRIEQEEEQARIEASPFAALSELRFDDNDASV